MSSIVLTLEIVQSLDELVLGTKVVGNYFRGKKRESFLLIYCLGVGHRGSYEHESGTRNKTGSYSQGLTGAVAIVTEL